MLRTTILRSWLRCPAPSIRGLSRSFYTFHIPADAKRERLDDGSTFITLHPNPVAGPNPLLTHKPASSISLPQLPVSANRAPATIADLPPPVRKQREVPYHVMTEAEINEARELRERDPDTWTVSQLARRYDVHDTTILALTRMPAERREWLERQEAERFERLTTARKIRLIDRVRRKAMW
ncbi:hypothetical protein HK101_008914 [Irineochytrium annulatum]|nr:hypothetical protein HK101_008914 [Irineochytrium annulatum]